MAENELGGGGSCHSVVPGPLPALRSSSPQPFTPCSRERDGGLPGRSCLPASAGSSPLQAPQCRAPQHIPLLLHGPSAAPV